MPVDPPLLTEAPSRRRTWWRGLLRGLLGWALGLSLTALTLMLAAWLGLHWLILPNIDQWRPDIEARASQTLGVPIRIGAIRVESKGWVPTIELHDVAFLDSQGQAALKLPKILASLSPHSVLALEPRFRQLLVDGAHLEIERNAQGHLSVAGIALDHGQDHDEGIHWLMRQGEVAILRSSLRFTDHQRGAPPLALSDMQLVILNSVRKHSIRLDATPPGEWGERFSVRGKFTQSLLDKAGNWRRWSGTLYSELPGADLSQLRAYIDLPFALAQGFGAARAWVDIQSGVPRAATVDVALDGVVVQLAPEVQPLALDNILGRLNFEKRGDIHRLSLQQFGFTTHSGIKWPRTDMSLGWQQTPGQPPRSGEFNAQWLDLDLMAQIADHLPLPLQIRQALAASRPQGGVQALAARWEGPLESPAHYRVTGRVRDLTARSIPPTKEGGLGQPGIEKATIDLAVTEKGGAADVSIAAGKLTFPGVFQEPDIPLHQLNTRVQWYLEPQGPDGPPRWVIEIPQVKASNDDFQIEARGKWSGHPHTHEQGVNPGILDLSGKLHGARGERVHRYLPQVIPLQVREYLSLALRGGKLGEITFGVKGNLKEFPFHATAAGDRPNGEFRIAGRVEDLTLAYIPDHPAQGDEPPMISPWPPLTKVAGDLVFDRDSMQIRNARGQYKSVQLNKIQARIKELGHNSVLVLDGQGQGPLADMLGFVNASPVGRWTQFALSEASGGGPAELRLGLNIPLAHPINATVKGSVALSGNDFRLAPEHPVFANTKGRVDFTHQGFNLSGLTTHLAGGESKVEGGWQLATGLRIQAQGQVTAEGLRTMPEWPGVARAARVLTGQTSYRLTLGLVHGHPDLTLSTDAVGLGINLPAPLGKSADSAKPWPFKLQIAPHPLDAPSAPPRSDTLSLTLGDSIRAVYNRDITGPAPRVLGGLISVSASPAESAGPTWPSQANSASGVAADLTLQSLNLDEWQAALLPSGAPNSAARHAGSHEGYLPNRITLHTEELLISSRRLQKVSAQISQEAGNWRALLDANQISGMIEYQPTHRGTQSRIVARLSRLNLPQADAAKVEALLQEKPPEALPALDITVDDFELRGKKLGRLEIDAASAPSGQDWKVLRLSMTTPEAHLKGQGQWVAVDHGGRTSPRRMKLDFKLDLKDSGLFLERMGLGRAIRGGKGEMAGQISWLGSPLTLDANIMTGEMKVAIDSGQFLKADPGAARLLGVLSLQALPRRLALDFRDVFQEGFAFDSITGDVTLFNGVASTTNLRMRGVQAMVLMEGNADLRHETQDLRVIVIPEINAGTASLAYAVVNPGLGLGTFLAQIFLRKPLAAAGTREFHISGSWVEPQVERIERKMEEAETRGAAPGEVTSGASPAPISPEGPR